MAKNAITDYSSTAANNTDIGGVDAQGSAAASNIDDLVRELASHLADMNAGTSPLADTFCIADAADLTKKVRFECSGITTATTRVITVPDSNITLAGSAAPTFTTSLTLTSTDAGAAIGPFIDLYRDSASPAASDIMGGVLFSGEDSAGNKTTYARIEAKNSDPTNASEDGILNFVISKAGTEADILTLNPNAITYTPASTSAVMNTNDDANALIIQGGNTASQGGQVFVYGDGHATAASDIAFFSDNVEKYRFDASAAQHKFTGNVTGTAGTLGTATASTSGTTIDYTSIPSGVREIIIMFSGLSTNGTDGIMVQIGDAGGFENTGYLGAAIRVDDTPNITAFTTGFGLCQPVAATAVIHGAMTLTLLDSSTFTWVSTVTGAHSDDTVGLMGGGSKSLSAELTQVRLTTTGGTDTFDAGKVNVLYR